MATSGIPEVKVEIWGRIVGKNDMLLLGHAEFDRPNGVPIGKLRVTYLLEQLVASLNEELDDIQQ